MENSQKTTFSQKWKNHEMKTFSQNEKCSRNEPGSRISSNLRTPDHLGRIPGQKNTICSTRNLVVRALFNVFQAREHSRNDPDKFWEKQVSPIFVDVRRNFRGVARFSPKIVIFHRNS